MNNVKNYKTKKGMSLFEIMITICVSSLLLVSVASSFYMIRVVNTDTLKKSRQELSMMSIKDYFEKNIEPILLEKIKGITLYVDVDEIGSDYNLYLYDRYYFIVRANTGDGTIQDSKKFSSETGAKKIKNLGDIKLIDRDRSNEPLLTINGDYIIRINISDIDSDENMHFYLVEYKDSGERVDHPAYSFNDLNREYCDEMGESIYYSEMDNPNLLDEVFPSDMFIYDTEGDTKILYMKSNGALEPIFDNLPYTNLTVSLDIEKYIYAFPELEEIIDLEETKEEELPPEEGETPEEGEGKEETTSEEESDITIVDDDDDDGIYHASTEQLTSVSLIPEYGTEIYTAVVDSETEEVLRKTNNGSDINVTDLNLEYKDIGDYGVAYVASSNFNNKIVNLVAKEVNIYGSKVKELIDEGTTFNLGEGITRDNIGNGTHYSYRFLGWLIDGKLDKSYALTIEKPLENTKKKCIAVFSKTLTPENGEYEYVVQYENRYKYCEKIIYIVKCNINYSENEINDTNNKTQAEDISNRTISFVAGMYYKYIPEVYTGEE